MLKHKFANSGKASKTNSTYFNTNTFKIEKNVQRNFWDKTDS